MFVTDVLPFFLSILLLCKILKSGLMEILSVGLMGTKMLCGLYVKCSTPFCRI